MSVLVAVKKGRRTVLASDGLTTFGSHRERSENISQIKFRRVGSALIGHAGWSMYSNILDDFLSGRKRPGLSTKKSIFKFFLHFWEALHEKYPFVKDQSEKDESPFGDLDATFLVCNRNGIFRVSSDTSVEEFKQYAAIGSGSDYAYGALHCLYDQEKDARTIARRAIEAGSQFDIYCGGEISIAEVPRG